MRLGCSPFEEYNCDIPPWILLNLLILFPFLFLRTFITYPNLLYLDMAGRTVFITGHIPFPFGLYTLVSRVNRVFSL